MSTTQATLIRTVAALASLGISAADIEALMQAERILHRWAERLCNDTWTDDDGKAWRNGYRGEAVRVPNPSRRAQNTIAAVAARNPSLRF